MQIIHQNKNEKEVGKKADILNFDICIVSKLKMVDLTYFLFLFDLFSYFPIFRI